VLPKAGKVYVLGRELALDETIPSTAKAAGYVDVERVGGIDRRDTSQLIGRELQALEPSTVRHAFIANGYTVADALSASAPASVKAPTSTRAPVLLVKDHELSGEVRDFLEDSSSITTVHVVGGNRVVDHGIEQQLRTLPQGPTVERTYGNDRFFTTTAVARRFFSKPSVAFVMSGYGFPVRTPGGVSAASIPVDALLAGPAAASQGAPLLFVRSSSVPDPVRAYLTANRSTIGLIVVIGGDVAVTPATRQQLLDALQ
jgi:putative cell wall-binding protein